MGKTGSAPATAAAVGAEQSSPLTHSTGGAEWAHGNGAAGPVVGETAARIEALIPLTNSSRPDAGDAHWAYEIGWATRKSTALPLLAPCFA